MKPTYLNSGTLQARRTSRRFYLHVFFSDNNIYNFTE